MVGELRLIGRGTTVSSRTKVGRRVIVRPARFSFPPRNRSPLGSIRFAAVAGAMITQEFILSPSLLFDHSDA